MIFMNYICFEKNIKNTKIKKLINKYLYQTLKKVIMRSIPLHEPNNTMCTNTSSNLFFDHESPTTKKSIKMG